PCAGVGCVVPPPPRRTWSITVHYLRVTSRSQQSHAHHLRGAITTSPRTPCQSPAAVRCCAPFRQHRRIAVTDVLEHLAEPAVRLAVRSRFSVCVLTAPDATTAGNTLSVVARVVGRPLL